MGNSTSYAELTLHGSLLLVDAVEDSRVELRLPVESIKPVNFLLDIVELGITEASNSRVEEKRFGELSVAFEKLFFSLRPGAVTPGFFIFLSGIPPDSTVLTDEIRLTRVWDMASRLSVDKHDRRCLEQAVKGFFELGDVLFVIVGIIDIGGNIMIPARSIDHEAGRIEPLGQAEDTLDEARKSLLPLFVKRAPADERRMAEIPLHSLGPFPGEDKKGIRPGDVQTPIGILAPYEVTEPIRPVKETLLEDALMEAGSVETEA